MRSLRRIVKFAYRKKCIMEVIDRTYEAPSTTVVDVKFEGIICLSPGGVGGTRDGYGDAIEDLWI